jgi:hypothetical protein
VDSYRIFRTGCLGHENLQERGTACRVEMMSLLLGLFAVAPTVKNCDPGSLFTVDSASLIPAIPLPGDQVTLNLKYTVPIGYVATEGKVKYDLTYNFIPLAPAVEPLCANIPCPLGPGTYVNNTVVDWPTGLTGTLVTKITWTDIMNVPLMCLRIDAKF